jgi:DNA ligase (NAD+)
MASPAQRIVELRGEINFHDRKYYDESRPVISDRDYDRLMQELIELEKAHPELVTPESPTMRVGGDVQTELKPVRHAVPMMSIDNTYNDGEIRAFDERVRKGLGGEQPAYVLEPKIDGTSINLRYENGKLVLGATRGRGNVGDDVTVNARTIKSIPLELNTQDVDQPPPAILEVRGEVYMDNEDFQRVNTEIVAEGDEAYANARNLTSGTLRRLDPKIVAKRRLRFLAHGLGQIEPMPAASYWDLTQLLKQWGLPLPKNVSRVNTIDEVLSKIHEFEAIRPKLPYMTDGMVVKVDSLAHREQLGATSKSPRWVVAYKYETEQQPTVLKNVRWQVGKGGNLTPVGELEPVFIGGVTVTNVTLHNIDQIKRLDLHFGDTVIVERAGEVIPYVVEAVPDKRPRGAKPIEAPKKCPSCQTPVIRLLGTPHVRCENPDCPGQLRERLIWFAGRGQMDIDGLGEAIIDQLLDSGRVSTYADLFRLKADQLADLTHETTVGENRATTILDSIHNSREEYYKLCETNSSREQREVGLKSYLSWLKKRLNWKELGPKTIDQLVDTKVIRKADDLFDLTIPKLAELTQQVRVGEVTAGKIVKNINDAKSRGLSRVLASLGIRLIGATAAKTFAEWAGDIDVLSGASLDDLAEVLAKDPDEKKKSADKERQTAKALYQSLHDAEQQTLFDNSDTKKQNSEEGPTLDLLTARDKQLARKDRLGTKRIADLAECFSTIIELENATLQEIADCLTKGIEVAKSLFEYLHSDSGKKVIDSLRKVGVKMVEQVAQRIESEWTGKTVVITGSFEGHTREKIKERLVLLGAKVADSVSSKTDIVFVGTEAGSKRDKAVVLGIKMEGEDAVRSLMEST